MRQRKCIGPYDLYSLKYDLVVVLQAQPSKPATQLTPSTDTLEAGMDLAREYGKNEFDRILLESFDNNHKYYSDIWDDLKTAYREYLRKHEFLPVSYNSVSNSFKVVIPSPGRPKTTNPKSVKVDLRLDAQTKARLDDYCHTNSIQPSEVIRQAIDLFLKDK